MDSLTRGLLGGVVAQTGFRQRIGRDATWVAALAAYSADLDILIPSVMTPAGAYVDGFADLVVHRGLSHSLLGVPVLAALFAVPWWWIRRYRALRDEEHADGRAAPFWLLYACCFAAAPTHPLLDWCTSYGTQLFAPFTRTRYAADCVGIIDMIYTPC